MVTALALISFAALVGLGVWHFRAKIERIGQKRGKTEGVIDFPRKDVAA